MTALFPGSFDPVTRGHLDIIERAARMADVLIVAVLNNSAKRPLFSVAERVAFLTEATRRLPNVRADAFSGLLAAYAVQQRADVIIRAVRTSADFDYEARMAQINRMLSGGLDTWLLTANPALSPVSGSVVREVARLGYADGFDDTVLDCMVIPEVKAALKARFG